MMTGTDHNSLLRRQWAAAQLKMNPDADTNEIRTALLKELARADFVPSPHLAWAMRELASGPTKGVWQSRMNVAALQSQENELRAAVEDFAVKFWQLEPSERRAHWEHLVACTYRLPSLQARLRDLQAGLDLPKPTLRAETDPRVVELAGHLYELFVLKPASRARAWQSLCAEMRNSPREWKAAAFTLRKRYPALASLQTSRIDEIASGSLSKHYKPSSKNLFRQPSKPKNVEKNTWEKPRYVIMFLWIAFIILRALMNSPTTQDPLKDNQFRQITKDNEDFVLPNGERIRRNNMSEDLNRLMDEHLKSLPPTKGPLVIDPHKQTPTTGSPLPSNKPSGKSP